MCEQFIDSPSPSPSKTKNPEDADLDVNDDTEEGTSKIELMETVVKKPQKKMPSYFKPTKASNSRNIAVPKSKTKRDTSPLSA